MPLESYDLKLLAIIDGGLNYDEVYSRAYILEISESLNVKVIGYDDLIQNKIMAR